MEVVILFVDNSRRQRREVVHDTAQFSLGPTLLHLPRNWQYTEKIYTNLLHKYADINTYILFLF
jgi:hypothetical protein